MPEPPTPPPSFHCTVRRHRVKALRPEQLPSPDREHLEFQRPLLWRLAERIRVWALAGALAALVIVGMTGNFRGATQIGMACGLPLAMCLAALWLLVGDEIRRPRQRRSRRARLVVHDDVVEVRDGKQRHRFPISAFGDPEQGPNLFSLTDPSGTVVELSLDADSGAFLRARAAFYGARATEQPQA